MYLRRCIGLVCALVLLCSCSNNSATETTNNNLVPADKKPVYDEFIKAFSTIELPYILPNPEVAEGPQLNGKDIDELFGNMAFKPAFGTTKDVPDLAENSESAKFYSFGSFKTDGYNALLIRKIYDGDYYYLATFSPDGRFMDGMCVAFTDGTPAEGTQRKASINDDQSIQVRQTDVVEGDASGEGESNFFEIQADGVIHNLSDTKSTADR